MVDLGSHPGPSRGADSGSLGFARRWTDQDRIQIKPVSSSILECIVSDREQLHLVISCMECEPFTMPDMLHISIPGGGGGYYQFPLDIAHQSHGFWNEETGLRDTITFGGLFSGVRYTQPSEW